MRAVVQRVASAKVTVDDEVTGAIERGLLVYLGVGQGDDDATAVALAAKITGCRIFENAAGKMDQSVVDVGGSVLVVSQFTLYGDLRRGRRPSFDGAMPPEPAVRLYERFVAEVGRVVPVATGRFRAHMRVESCNDGPVTLLLDSADTKP